MARVIGRQQCVAVVVAGVQCISTSKREKEGAPKLQFNEPNTREKREKKEIRKPSLSLCVHSSFIDPL